MGGSCSQTNNVVQHIHIQPDQKIVTTNINDADFLRKEVQVFEIAMLDQFTRHLVRCCARWDFKELEKKLVGFSKSEVGNNKDVIPSILNNFHEHDMFSKILPPRTMLLWAFASDTKMIEFRNTQSQINQTWLENTIKILLEYKANPTRCIAVAGTLHQDNRRILSRHCEIPIFASLHFGNLNVVKQLVNAKADVNTVFVVKPTNYISAAQWQSTPVLTSEREQIALQSYNWIRNSMSFLFEHSICNHDMIIDDERRGYYKFRFDDNVFYSNEFLSPFIIPINVVQQSLLHNNSHSILEYLLSQGADPTFKTICGTLTAFFEILVAQMQSNSLHTLEFTSNIQKCIIKHQQRLLAMLLEFLFAFSRDVVNLIFQYL